MARGTPFPRVSLLCLGTDEFTWAEGSSYSSGVGITWAKCSGLYTPPKSDIQYITKASQQTNTAAPAIRRRAGDQ